MVRWDTLSRNIRYLLLVGLLLVVLASPASAWYDLRWTKRAPVTITNPAAGVEMNVTLTYDADMMTNFTDIRVVDDNDVTLLPMYFENWTTSGTANVWFRTADAGSTVYIYYGKSSASSNVSDGYATFHMFDHFDGGSLNTSQWKVQHVTSQSYGNSRLKITGGSGTVRRSNNLASLLWFDTPNYLAEGSIQANTGNVNEIILGWNELNTSGPDNCYGPANSTTNISSFYNWQDGNAMMLGHLSTEVGRKYVSDPAGSTYQTWIVGMNSSAAFVQAATGYQLGGVSYGSYTLNRFPMTICAGVYDDSAGAPYYGTLSFDWIRVRKMPDTPWVTALGAEQALPVAAFSCTPTYDLPPTTVTCTDASTGGPTSWYWSVENSTGPLVAKTSTNQNPTFDFSLGGKYNVNMSATNAGGTDWENKTMYLDLGCRPYTTIDGVYTIAKFNVTGVCNWTMPSGITSVQYLIVAGGGGGGGGYYTGGGGGGGFVNGSYYPVVGGTVYNVTIGGGGTGGPSTGTNGLRGGNSSFGNTTLGNGLQARGGGGGMTYTGQPLSGFSSSFINTGSGGSGGAGAGSGTAGSGNYGGFGINGTIPQGFDAGYGQYRAGGGGGGAGGIGGNGDNTATGVGGNGGIGNISCITGTCTYYGGGGGGGVYTGTPGTGGAGGGGDGGEQGVTPEDGTADLGGGGGGADEHAPSTGAAGDGGSGVVILKFGEASPVSAFSCTPLSGTSNFDVVCTDASTETPTSWYWSVENGSVAMTSTKQNPIFNMSWGDLYNVNMSATNGAGTDWENKSAYVLAYNMQPTINWNKTPNAYGNISSVVKFVDWSTGVNLSDDDYGWNFTVSNVRNTTYTYSTWLYPNEFQYYHVNHSVVDSADTPWNKTWWRNTTEGDGTYPPIRIFQNLTPTSLTTPSATTGTRPLPVTWTNNRVGHIEQDYWLWVFDIEHDDPYNLNQNTSTSESDIYIYTRAGLFTTRLYSGNYTLGNGSYDKIDEVLVYNAAPTVGWTITPTPPTVINLSTGLSISDTSIGTNITDPLASYTLWGDGNASYGFTPKWYYNITTPIDVPFSLNHSITDSPGTHWALSDWDNQSGVLWVVNDTVNFTLEVAPTSGNRPLVVTPTLTPDGGRIMYCNYSWGDGNVTNGSSFSPPHTYDVDGVFTLNATCGNDAGMIDPDWAFFTVEKIITVSMPPTADFSCTPRTGVVTVDVECTDATVGTPTSWYWSVENGSVAMTSTKPNPIFNVSFADWYNVNMSATNSGGTDWENKTQYVLVNNSLPIPIISINTTTQYVNGAINLSSIESGGTNISSGSVPGFVWMDHFITNTSNDYSPNANSIYTWNTHLTSGWMNNTVTWPWYPICYDVTKFGGGTYTWKYQALSTSGYYIRPTATWAGVEIPGTNDAPHNSGTHYYLATIKNSNNWEQIYLYKVISGAYTDIGGGAVSVAVTPYGNDTVSWDPSTGAIKVYHNDNLIFNVVDNAITNPGYMCGYYYADTTTDLPFGWDYWRFSNTTGGYASTPNNVVWVYSDGTTATTANDTKTFSAAGVYTANLSVTDSYGTMWNGTSWFNGTEIIVKNEPPIPRFYANTTTQVVNYQVNFTNTSIGTNMTRFYYTFGDTGTSTPGEPGNTTHTYTDWGWYTVSLSVNDSYGTPWQSDNTTILTDYIHIINDTPTVDFHCTPKYIQWDTDTFACYDDSTGDGIIGYNWTWGWAEGTSTAKDVTGIVTSNAGAFWVNHTVSSLEWPDVMENRTYYVVAHNPAPTNTWTTNITNQILGGGVNFTDSSTGTNLTASAGSSLFYWSFGDGASATTDALNYTYSAWPAAGLYDINHSVTDSPGTLWNYSSWSNQTHYIGIWDIVTADFSGTPKYGAHDYLVTFTDSSTNENTWSWDFGDGGSSALENPTYTYTTPGAYYVCLTASNPASTDIENKTFYIVVTSTAPTSAFSASDTTPYVDETVTFTSSSSIENASFWYWDFGDGTGAHVEGPVTHEYAAPPATYTVILNITDSNLTLWNLSDSEVKVGYITTSYKAPDTAFNCTPTSGSAILTVTCTDSSASLGSSISAWSWDFGDGGTSVLQNPPPHQYLVGGDYTVSLTTTNLGGSTTVTFTDYIHVISGAGGHAGPWVPNASMNMTYSYDMYNGTYMKCWLFNMTNQDYNHTAHGYNTTGLNFDIYGIAYCLMLPILNVWGYWIFLIVWSLYLLMVWIRTNDIALPLVIGIITAGVWAMLIPTAAYLYIGVMFAIALASILFKAFTDR